MNCLIVTNMMWGSIRPLSPICCDKTNKVLENIVKASGDYSFCFIINDSHEKLDSEFEYIPPHNIIGSGDTSRLLSREEKIKCQQKQFLTKNHVSAIHSDHNKKLILSYGFSDICISGFSASIDIIPTCLDFMMSGQKIHVYPELLGDLNDERKNKALDYLNFMGFVKD